MNSGSQDGFAAIAVAYGLPARAISDSRDLFLAALDISADLIYIVDPASGRFMEVNQTTCSALGYARDELLAMNIQDLHPPAFVAGFKDRLAQLVAVRPQPLIREAILRRRDGTEFPVEIHTRAVEFGGKVVIVSVTRDISESQRVDDELRRSEERFFKIFRASPAAMSISTLEEGLLLDVNDRYVELFGYPREDVIGRSHEQRQIWVDPGQRADVLRRIKSGETIRNIEARFRRKSGDIAVVLFSVEVVPLGGQPVAVTMRVDITERKRAEEALRRSEERFALFMQHLPGAAFIKDAQGRYVYANRVCEISQRVQPGEWAGKTDDELYTAESARQFKANDRQVFDSGNPLETIESAIWDNDVQHWLVNKFPIPASQASGPLLGGAAFNVTELKRSEAALRQALGEREDLARDLHDGIVQEIYAIGLGLEEISRNVAHDAPSAANGLAQAIGGLNQVIRKVRGHILGATPQFLDGHQLRAELQQLAQTADWAHRLRFRLNIDQEAVSRLTPDAAIQVLNIVREAMSNSLRHSFGRHGLVSLRVHKRGVRIVVEDDGDGFEPQDARSDGQGLHNMATRASQLNARLDIQSSPGAGTRITLDIPGKNGSGAK